MTEENKKKIKDSLITIRTNDYLLNVLSDIRRYEFGETEEDYDFEMKQLTYHSNPKLNSHRYTSFSIPKKSGGMRDIMAPNRTLKLLQICANKLLQIIYTPNSHVYGFTEGRSIVDGAKIHIYQNYVFNIDLKDFFLSIDQARVWKRLQCPPFNFTQEVASSMAGLCCHPMWVERKIDGEWKRVVRSVLPQGAPTSPTLTNIICERLDYKLIGLAKRFGLRYTRYADDITFSSMHNVYQEGGEFRKELERIIEEQHFRINPKKTRLQGSAERQEVTGLIVSDRVNVSKLYIKQLRVMLHNWEIFGYEEANNRFQLCYNRKGLIPKSTNMKAVLRGKLDFLQMVKGENNDTYKKLCERYDRLVNRLHSDIEPQILIDLWRNNGLEKAVQKYKQLLTE